jgi:DNA-directed RNA polymerase specialized sigma24 family protein
MCSAYRDLQSFRDDLISDAVIKVFRVIDDYLVKNKDFNGQFANICRNACRQVTWDFMRREFKRRPATYTLYDRHEDGFTFPDIECTVEHDVFDACNDERDTAIVTRRAAGETQQKIADDLGISRTQVINRLNKIGERYKWTQVERDHDRLTVRKVT